MRDQPGSAAHGRALMEMSIDGWHDEYPSARDLMAQSFAPEASPHDQRSYSEFMKLAMDHKDWLKVGKLVAEVDIREQLPKVSCPTLVLHSNKDRMHSFEQGRLLASGISNSRLVGLDTTNNTMPEYDPDWTKSLIEIESFLVSL